MPSCLEKAELANQIYVLKISYAFLKLSNF